jgi:hypothetical protein
MTRLRLGTVAGLVAPAALVLLSGCSTAGSNAPTATPTTPVTVAPAAPLVTTTVPARPAVTVTVPAAPTTSAPEQVVRTLTARGAILAPPARPDRRTENPPFDCNSIGDPGWQVVDCRSTQMGTGLLTYLIELQAGTDGPPGARAYVFRQNADGTQQVMLEAADDQGTRFNNGEVDALITTGLNGPAPAIVFAFHEADPAQTLAIDIVEATGVAAHQSVATGVATTAPGELDTWSAPSAVRPGATWTHDVIRSLNGAWQVASEDQVSKDEVPNTQFA